MRLRYEGQICIDFEGRLVQILLAIKSFINLNRVKAYQTFTMDNHQPRKPSTDFEQRITTIPTEYPAGQNILTIVQNNFNGNFEEATNFYYKEGNKLFFANVVLNNQLKTVTEEKNALAARLSKLEQQKGDNAMMEDKKKRHRRTAGEIQRSYKCPINSCYKSYGSEGSLSQHLKIKHPEHYLQYASLNEKEEERQDNENKTSNKPANL